MKTNIALGLAVVALIIAGIAYLGHTSKTLFGSTACSNITCLSGGLRLVTGAGGDFESDVAAIVSGGFKIGTNGTNLTQLVGGTCSLIASSFTVAATSTVAMDCAVSNITSTDIPFAQFATSSAILEGWSIAGSSASSTAGFITIDVTNGTGASNVIPASIASTTKYVIFH